MMNLPLAAAAASAHARAIVKALRATLPPPPNFELERQVLAEAGGPMPLGGWNTYHDPEAKTFTQVGTVCGVEVTPPRIGHYHSPTENIDTMGDATIHHVAGITGETYTDILCDGRRRWFGPDG